MTAISPSNLELYYENRFYAPTKSILRRSARRCARNTWPSSTPASSCRSTIRGWRPTTTAPSDASIEDCRKFIALRVEVLNHALRGIPEDRIRFHTCYSVNIAPRVHDFELKHFVDLMLQVRAGAYVIEAANPRHEHEWQIWEEVTLPDDQLLIPGVVSHCVHLVEHPELVAQRIARFAGVVGRERVIAGTDCGFGTVGRRRRGASGRGVGQAAGAGRRREDREPPAPEMTRFREVAARATAA